LPSAIYLTAHAAGIPHGTFSVDERNVMPESATPHQSATAAPPSPRPSRNGSAPPLSTEMGRERPQRAAMLPMALTRLRTMMRRLIRRP